MRTCCYIILASTLAQAALWAEVRLSLSKTTVAMGESFSVDFYPQDNSSRVPPDFAPLQEDFSIISQGQSHSTTIINGKISVDVHWHVVLKPKSEGLLTLPSIAFGHEHSLPSPIMVSEKRASKPDMSMMLEASLLPQDVIYEHTQLVYVVRLFRAVNLAQGTLSELKTSDPDTLIERLGTDRQYDHIHQNGTRYVVFERQYIVSPQHAGELTFLPIVFEGEVIKGANTLFNVQTDFKRLISKEEKVIVKPIPPPFQKNNWHAARDVQLSEEWSADPRSMTVGEPVTWTLTVTAEGCMACQIPDLQFDLPPTIKHYLDKTEQSNKTTKDGLTGVKQFKIALIPTQEGEVTLPKIGMDWWNLKTDKAAHTSLPERKITVNASPLAMARPQVAGQDTLASNAGADATAISAADLPSWVWGSLFINLLSGMGLLFILGKWIFGKFMARRGAKMGARAATSMKDVRQQLQQACEYNDAKQAATYLLAWFKLLHPEAASINLVAMKDYLPPPFQDAVNALHTHLYSPSQAWQGQNLWLQVKAFKKASPHTTAAQSQGLPNLYPS